MYVQGRRLERLKNMTQDILDVRVLRTLERINVAQHL
jgi:hypothetical protein